MMTEEMARAAARWWRDKIDGGARHDNGDDGAASRLACLMADCLNTPTDKERLDVFENELTRALMKEGEDRDIFSIWSDYFPDRLLFWAAKAAGISGMNFPFKAWMFLQVNNGEVVVMDGYRKPLRVIWTERKEKEG
jgi:hypothetical protein